MRSKAVLASLTLVTLLFAGCAGGGDGDGTSTSTSTSRSGTGSATTTSTGAGGAANQPPTGAVEASAISGAAPLAVDFSLTGSDPEGDPLEWTLSFGDGTEPGNGTELPATVAHNYTTSGNFTAVFTLNDGSDRVSYNVTLNVTGGASVPTGAPIVLEFATVLPCPDCFYAFESVMGCVEWQAGEPGLRCDWKELPPEASGRAFTLTGSVDPDVEFFTECDPAATSLAWFSNEGDEADLIPAGAGCAVVYDFAEVQQAMTMTIV